MRPARIALGALAAAVLMAGTAHADEFISAMKRNHCEPVDGVPIFPTRRFVTLMAQEYGVGYMEASDAAQLGTVAARDVARDCGPSAACAARSRLYRRVRDLLADPPRLNAPRGNDRFAIELASGAPSAGGVEQVLNNNAPWFRIVCLGNLSGDDAPPAEVAGYLGRAIIGETVDDAVREFSNRKFASFAFTDDQAADTQSFAINAAVVFPRLGSDPELRREGLPIQPFIALQRNFSETAGVTKRDVDDLTFGITSPFMFGGEDRGTVHFVTTTLEWETDTEFESSVGSARVVYEPISPRIPCLGQNMSGDVPLRCELRLVADWIDVFDPGDKPALATSPDFLRAGFDVGLNYDFTPPDFPGQLIFTIDYARREDLDSDVGDADLFRTGFVLQPSKRSHFSFGLEFSSGEDISSLQEQRQFVLKLGYRR